MRPNSPWVWRLCALLLWVCARATAQQPRTLAELASQGMGAGSGVHRLDDITVRQPGEWPRLCMLGSDRVVVWFQPVEASALRRREGSAEDRLSRVLVFDMQGKLLARRELQAETLRLWPARDALIAQVSGRTEVWNTDLSVRAQIPDAPVTVMTRSRATARGGSAREPDTVLHLGQPLLFAPDGTWLAWQTGDAAASALRIVRLASPEQREDVPLEGSGLITVAGEHALVRLQQAGEGKRELMPLAQLPCPTTEFADRQGRAAVWLRDPQWRASACAEPIAFAGENAAVWLVDSDRHDSPAVEVVRRSGEVLLAAPLPGRQSASVCAGDAAGSWVGVCVFRPMLSRGSRYAAVSVEQVIKLDLTTGKVWRRKLPLLSSAAFSADGKRLVWLEGALLRITDVP